MATTAIVGCTGMVGAHILTTLLSNSNISHTHILARRQPPSTTTTTTPNLSSHISADTSTWPSNLTNLHPPPSIFFSSLATTRAAAGSFSAQYTLEHDVNIRLAAAAKSSGTSTCVLISSAGANPSAYFAYPRMKGEIEEDVKRLGFDHTVILRPGLIAGKREERRMAEAVFRKIADVAGRLSGGWLKDGWAQEAEVIARAAVKAGVMCERGEVKEKVWVLGQADIVRLGRTEWKG